MSTSSSSISPDIEPFRITISRGDGIGPEIMAGVLRILDAAGARLVYDEIDIGEQVYLDGN
ncbi:MAG: isocitrate dehydrogenase, partial [Planctomycetota bacterium]